MKKRNIEGRFLIIALAVLGTVLLVGCSRSQSAASKPSGSAAKQGIKIGIIATIDDGGFGESSYKGITDYLAGHSESSETHIKEDDIGKLVQAVADIVADYDVLVCPGFTFTGIGETAIANPDKKFLLIDAAPTNKDGETLILNNVYSMVFSEQESGFFAGVAAALETKTKKVSVVNGIAYPTNVNYQYGFESGVQYSNAHFGTTVELVELPSYAGIDVTGTNVGGNYIGSFTDAATGKIVGSALIEKGVDIIFVAAGGAGNGVFAALKEGANNLYAIGVDVDQYGEGGTGSRNIILTSAVKNISLNVTRQLEAISAGTFAGQNALLDASTDSTGYITTPGRHQLSANTLGKLEEVYGLVKNGTIKPPANFSGTTPENFPGLR